MAGKNRIVIKESKNHQKYILVKSKNNKTLASTETLKSNQAVKKSVVALKKVVKNAQVIDQTKKKRR